MVAGLIGDIQNDRSRKNTLRFFVFVRKLIMLWILHSNYSIEQMHDVS